MTKKPILIGLFVVIVGIILVSALSSAGSGAPETVSTNNTEVTVDQGRCLFNCEAQVIVAEEGAEVEVYNNDQSTVFGDTTNQQGEALNNQHSTFGGNTASLGAEGSSANLQEGQNLNNEQDSSADKGDPPKLGTVPGWMWFGAFLVIIAFIYFGFIRPRMLASQLDR